jgi:uncharacterized protein YegJ (DUF2314 family)
MNWHEVIDERSYEQDQVIVGILRDSPGKLSAVVDWIEKRLADPRYSIQGKDALSEWMNVIRDRGVHGVIDLLESRSEEADRMRQSTPFACLMPQDTRDKVFAKYESLRTRTSLAGV